MKKLVFFAAYPELVPTIKRLMHLSRYRGIFAGSVVHYYPNMYDQTVDEDGDLAIVRGYSVQVLKEKYDGPLIEIPVTGSDIVNTIALCRERANPKKIGIIGDYSNLKDIEAMISLSNLNLKVYMVNTPEEIDSIVQQAVAEGCDALISGAHAEKCILYHGYQVYSEIIKISEETIIGVLDEAVSYIKVMEAQNHQFDSLKLVADNMSDGFILTDGQGKIDIINVPAMRMLDTGGRVLGKQIEEAFPYLAGNCKRVREEQTPIDNVLLTRNKIKLSVDFLPTAIENDSCSGTMIVLQDIERLQQKEIRIRNKLSENGLIARYTFADIIHQSPEMDRLIERARKYAAVVSNVLIYGETGTGKELMAQGIHNASERKDGPFVAVNCASIPEHLLESELFGYEEGAFTGAVKGGKAGLFEAAHRGTIFLDEVSELPLGFQNKILRVIQEREIRRVGGKKVIKIDVRIVAATNKNLRKMVERGEFREDLLYRLDVLKISIPALRQRTRDIKLLAEYYLSWYSSQFRTPAERFSDSAMKLLCEQPFKGNIRELRNLMERLSVTIENREVGLADVRELLEEDIQEEILGKAAEEIRREDVERLLKEMDNNKTRVAKSLGINRTTLWRKMKKWGMISQET
ncbi:MAG: sigma 54-interacting transcriptional regulator [Lachnospiraceae bacterium]|nr:sigma 54-interacting transcriptional regulator [Lachnospiraceae bacterium]